MAERRKLDPSFATMADIMETAGMTRRTIRVWIAKGCLAQPTKVSHGYPDGIFNRFPAHVLEQVRFTLSMRAQGLSLDEIAALVQARDWTKGGLPAGPTVRSRGDAPPPARAAKPRRR